MTEDKTVLERLQRLQDIAEDVQEQRLDDTLTSGHELVHGLGNIIREVKECLEDEVRDCVHCGSPFTFRRSDGDIACYDCPGIMPQQYRCPGCRETGTKEELQDSVCERYDNGNHEIETDTRICLRCGEQGTPHELQKHDCPFQKVKP